MLLFHYSNSLHALEHCFRFTKPIIQADKSMIALTKKAVQLVGAHGIFNY